MQFAVQFFCVRLPLHANGAHGPAPSSSCSSWSACSQPLSHLCRCTQCHLFILIRTNRQNGQAHLQSHTKSRLSQSALASGNPTRAVRVIALSRPKATLPLSKHSCMRFCVVHELRVVCFKQLFVTLTPFIQEHPNLSTKSKAAKESVGHGDSDWQNRSCRASSFSRRPPLTRTAK